MATTYITGYDGSDASRAALRWTARLAAATGAEVVAANVYPQTPVVLGKGASSGALRELRDEAQASAEKTLGETGVADVQHVAVGAGSPAEGLHRLAEDQGAALVAVGTTHRGAIGRLIGSIGDRLLHGSPAPVAVVPTDAGEREIATVGVAFDDREESRAALAAAKELAGRLDARLVVLAVNEPIHVPYAGYGAPVIDPELEMEIAGQYEEQIRKAAEEIVGADAEVRILGGGAAARTLAEAAADDIDVLVTGSRGYGPIKGVLLGSVTRYLVDHAPCPVLVLPRGVAADALTAPAHAQAR